MKARFTPFARLLLTLAVVTFAVSARSAEAEIVTYTADLAGKSEVPPNDAAGTGTVDATFDTVTKTLMWTVSFAGLSGPASAAHFHGPAAAGANAGPIITLDPAKLVSPIKGEAKLTDAQAADLAKGLWYLNVHTAKHPPGEIRGQLVKK